MRTNTVIMINYYGYFPHFEPSLRYKTVLSHCFHLIKLYYTKLNPKHPPVPTEVFILPCIGEVSEQL